MGLNASILLNRFTLRAKFRHMHLLIALAEFGSMRKAAIQLNMTQPAVSQTVAELERLMETKLFLRHARGVSLTTAGAELLPAAQQILSILGDAAERIANEMQQKGGVVRIAASPAAVGGVLQGTLAAFSRTHPDIQLHIVPLRDGNSISEALDNNSDLILMRAPTATPEGWSFVELVDDRLTAVCAPSHPLISCERPSDTDLSEATWMLHRVGSVARNKLENRAARHDWPSLKLCQIDVHIPSLTRDLLVSCGYAALLPRSVLLAEIETGALKEVISPLTEPLAPLGFMWKPENGRVGVRKFAKFLADYRFMS
ncbi:HTH-type transcriptional regulator GbpR [Sulfitobacter sp. DSM 110093]|uniref:LysR family transcriptional regulator n=1 Tax=Sulfitobacter sp. DSM 110093 TaxID=2883127 RepID=UPI001FAE6EFE|nr:LysR family transcriptional regulator [Sulfitobacter sp. DSM 110093]UOA32798.1 HTH-type transcriptional regulator GbpR [Sulfitobacter sp. DSM 110093]